MGTFDHEPHGDRAAAQVLITAALKKANLKSVYSVLRGTFVVIEFASETDAENAVASLLNGSVYLGNTRKKIIIGQGAAVGNPPRRVNKKRSRDQAAMPMQCA